MVPDSIACELFSVAGPCRFFIMVVVNVIDVDFEVAGRDEGEIFFEIASCGRSRTTGKRNFLPCSQVVDR